MVYVVIRSLLTAALVVLALGWCAPLGGCHLIFRYEDRTPDAAPPAPDMARLDGKTLPDKNKRKDLPPPPPDTAIPADKGGTLTKVPSIAMQVPTGTGDLYAMWGTSINDIYAVGKDATLLRYDGSSWKRIAMVNPVSGEDFTGVWRGGSNKTDLVYISTTKGHVRTYSPSTGMFAVAHTANETLFDVHGGGGGHVQAVGEDGTMVLTAGSGWKPESLKVTTDFNGVWTFPSGESYLVGDAGTAMRHFKLGANIWSNVPIQMTPPCKFQAVWGTTASSKVYAVGLDSCSVALSSSGVNPVITAFTPSMKADWYGIWGTSKGELFLVGHDPQKPEAAPINHFNGVKWISARASVSPKQMTLRGIWGDNKGKLFAVGHGGVILRN